MDYQIQFENIKCGGCASTIRTKLAELEGIDAVDVDIAEGLVRIEGNVLSRTAALPQSC